MTKPTESTTESNRQTRKSTIWTQDKIAQLIKLYHQHECLWNHFISSYKSKENRTKAVEDICKTLRITKFDFGKKIHNLRNQFNSEMKKLERRIGEMGGTASELTPGNRCRWEHFESLMFLQDVIEPRPAGYQTPATPNMRTNGHPQVKKMRLKFELANEEDSAMDCGPQDASSNHSEQHVTEYHYETTTVGGAKDEEEATLAEQIAIDNFEQYEEVDVPTASATTTSAVLTATASNQKSNSSAATSSENATTIAIVELPNSVTTCSRTPNADQSAVPSNRPVRRRLNQATDTSCSTSSIASVPSGRDQWDQWDAFGELIAVELRNLNSDNSRKKLKRKIMQAILEVGAEDDLTNNQ